jgi:hypothetical protein
MLLIEKTVAEFEAEHPESELAKKQGRSRKQTLAGTRYCRSKKRLPED